MLKNKGWAISVGLCYQIVTKDLNIIRTFLKSVPRILTKEKKEVRMELCQNMIEMTPIDPEQRIERGEPKPKNARRILYVVDVTLVKLPAPHNTSSLDFTAL
ncbi:hypothetical protein LAZ67_1007228 [Cordylochernes scorpioides]|uniref:Uncharacterized protein n=1 Tax=Cordylochernes scorpioides TaxID=51811 RepID=A0ABY6K0Z8_9ARAC|nr:hypothetical protein LAZ67_1007228 [Cordylochernes scorpioides]